VGGRYRPIPAAPDGSLVSQVTGLRLTLEGMRLRLVDLANGQKLPWTTEERAAREAAEAARDAERTARMASEAQRAIERTAREAAEAQRDAAEAKARAAEEEILRLRRALDERP
jgi:hypothetical protein